ncbi:MAG: tRNA (adenosine(37)-N6)-threonylcarbamoyltransferase complex dimerization subunit type 1 TsaB [Firmicutes bacterium]|nr:tRNA (adenosine(37)-N6)-threonylcarbamoyltransferase complex dimerization subunit type 1 TsaB [Bacillota bacterium]
MRKYNYLAIDAAGSSLTVVLHFNGKYYTFTEANLRRTSAVLLPSVSELLGQAGASLNDMDYFGVTIGPGSFTGIRVGLVTVKAWNYATKKPIIAVNSLKALAYTSKSSSLCVIDGSNGVSYIAAYNNVGEETLSPKCIYTKDLDKEVKSGYEVIYGEKVDSVESLWLAVEDGIAKNMFCDYTEVMPMYIRKSQPERGVGDI